LSDEVGWVIPGARAIEAF